MPRGKWSAKDERMYKHILKSCKKKRRGQKKVTATCQRIAASTVNMHRGRRAALKKGKGRRKALKGLGSAKRKKLYAEHIRIDRGGYDSTGRYWGAGERLYRVSDEAGELDTFVRAPSAAAAKKKAARDPRAASPFGERRLENWSPFLLEDA